MQGHSLVDQSALCLGLGLVQLWHAQKYWHCSKKGVVVNLAEAVASPLAVLERQQVIEKALAVAVGLAEAIADWRREKKARKQFHSKAIDFFMVGL